MNTQNWLSLIEYSAKFRVSLSTLRRRIKAAELEYKLIEGKYLIKNEPLPGHANVGFSSQAGSETIAPPPQVSSQNHASTSPASAAPVVPADEYWTATESLLAEMKKAYSQTLAVKDDQIKHLKGELGDIKMLVKMLEDENQRLKMSPSTSFDLDLGLEA